MVKTELLDPGSCGKRVARSILLNQSHSLHDKVKARFYSLFFLPLCFEANILLLKITDDSIQDLFLTTLNVAIHNRHLGS